MSLKLEPLGYLPEESMSLYLNANVLFILFSFLVCVTLRTGPRQGLHMELYLQLIPSCILLYFETGPYWVTKLLRLGLNL